MFIRKHWNHNEYCLAGHDIWVRNFTKKAVAPMDINNLITEQDMRLMLQNEMANRSKMLQKIESEDFNHENVLIISDGHGFEEHDKLKIPDNTCVIGVNDVLGSWSNPKRMNYYVTNNPYPECVQVLEKGIKTSPRCIVSTRTHPSFLDSFRGNGIFYEYSPVVSEFYSGIKTDSGGFIDDYRNPICAALGVAFKFGVKNLLLAYCDDFYKENRPSCVKVGNFYAYEEQIVAHDITDANLFWLKSCGIKAGYHSMGPEYKHASYINQGEITNFFTRL